MSYFKQIDSREKSILAFSEQAPEWVRNAVEEAHFGSSTCDWVFDICRLFFEFNGPKLMSNANIEDIAYEFAISECDSRAPKLAQWYQEHCLHEFMLCAEEDLEETDLGGYTISDHIRAAQIAAISRIAKTLMEAMLTKEE